MRYLFLFMAFVIFTPLDANATYVVTSPIKGEVCKSLAVASSCKFEPIDAMANWKGDLFELPKYYVRVHDYNGKTCAIMAKSEGMGIISWIINKTSRPTYLKQVGGSFQKVNARRLVFQCDRR
jgi:hypothetical protein